MNIFDSIVRPIYAAADDVIGTISVPTGVPSDVTKSGGFVTGIVRFLMVVAGIFTLWQFLSGGFSYISSNGDKGKISEAMQKIQTSILGLIVMTISFILISIISKLLFGSFTFILSPSLQSIE